MNYIQKREMALRTVITSVVARSKHYTESKVNSAVFGLSISKKEQVSISSLYLLCYFLSMYAWKAKAVKCRQEHLWRCHSCQSGNKLICNYKPYRHFHLLTSFSQYANALFDMTEAFSPSFFVHWLTNATWIFDIFYINQWDSTLSCPCRTCLLRGRS